MTWPFVSRDRYQEMTTLKDQRIADLEAERKMLWDKICLLGIGAPAFSPTLEEQPCHENDTEIKPKPHARTGSMRPSAIMRRMDRLAEARWLRKMYPSRTPNAGEEK